MSYKDKYGITEIFKRGKDKDAEVLSVSWDCDDDEKDLGQRTGMFLYVPRFSEHEHEHIAFGLQDAKTLRDWLTDYIDDLESHGVKEVKNFLLK